VGPIWDLLMRTMWALYGPHISCTNSSSGPHLGSPYGPQIILATGSGLAHMGCPYVGPIWDILMKICGPYMGPTSVAQTGLNVVLFKVTSPLHSIRCYMPYTFFIPTTGTSRGLAKHLLQDLRPKSTSTVLNQIYKSKKAS